MSEPRPYEPWEERLQEAARTFQYPPTPDVARSVRVRLRAERLPRAARRSRPQRQWLPAATAVVFLLLGLLAVPDVRAALLTFLRVGAVTIIIPTPDQAATARAETAAVPPTPPSAAILAPSSAPAFPAWPVSSVLNLAGETDLEAARRRVPFPIRLPAYPPDLGPPDRVYVQELGGLAAILVWLVPGTDDQALLSLHILAEDAFAEKVAGERTTIQETTVNGAPAYWVRGPHILRWKDRRGGIDLDPGRLVEGNVLIWVEEGITYRLETGLPLEEAVRSAESLR